MMSCKGRKKGQKRQPSMPKSGGGAEQPAATPSNARVEAPADASSSPSGTATSPKICQHYSNGNNAVDCKGHRTGVLTGNEIKRYGIIDNNDTDCLQATSYDLRLGEGHMVYDSTAKKWLAKWVSSESPPDGGNPPYKSDGSNLVIPRFGMALIQLRETIDLLSCMQAAEDPVVICGHFDLKLSRVREGLISQQATQVEPGYHGKLFCYLFNQTGDEIYLSYTDTTNDKIATIEFQYVSCISQCDSSIRQEFVVSLPEKHRKYSLPYCTPHGIKDVRYFDGAQGEDGKLPKHGGLSSIDQSLVDAQENARKGCAAEIKAAGKLRAWAIGLLAIVITLFTIVISMSLFIQQRDMRDKIVKVWELIDDKSGDVGAITAEANAAKASLEALRDEAQKAAKMAKTESEELDRQKKELLLQKNHKSSETTETSNVKKDKGGNQ